MDKFITSLPRKRKASWSSASSPSNFWNLNNTNTNKLTPASQKTKTNNPNVYGSNDTNSNYSNTKSRSVQMFIDLGQKSFGKSITCKECGCFYLLGDLEDEKMHKAFCKKKKEGLKLTNLKGYRIIETFKNNNIIIEINSNSTKYHCKDVKEAVDFVKQELGSSNDNKQSSVDSSSSSSSSSSSRGSREDVKCYLYLKGLSIQGLLISQSLATVKREQLVRLSDTKRTTDALIEKKEEVEKVAERVLPNTNECQVGVDLIWVDSKCRRQGIAKKLCDSVRRHFMYGSIVSKQNLAFSQPTSNGHCFALAYSGTMINEERERSYYAYKE